MPQIVREKFLYLITLSNSGGVDGMPDNFKQWVVTQDLSKAIEDLESFYTVENIERYEPHQGVRIY